ncbi:protein kinase domain-containing protein [Rothia kristinae]|uniref:protein kinase domain-containing protein n=1 Tax=Rothia kristinae TaxID=37923 RepID=UPI0009C0182D|nr:protein kinase [Rothia kristinae]
MRPTGPGPLSGRTVEGRYLLGDLIARGGMGTVYRGRDLRLGRPVAVKVLKESVAADPRRTDRFAAEARAAAAVADPHVVAVWDQGVDETGPEPLAFLVMELVDGATLRDLIKRRSPMTVREMLRVAVPMTAGVAAAHRCGLVHRDIKPENVLTSPTGSVKVADFGLTRPVQEDSATLTLIGSANYIAPEVVRRESSGPPADLYSLGVILYEMLTGVPPFRGPSPYAVSMAHVDEPFPVLQRRFPGVDPEVADIVVWCCEKDPEHRPQRAADLLGELEHLRESLTPAALDLAPPGHRPETEDLFSVLRTDSHTDPTGLRAVPAEQDDPDAAPPPRTQPTRLLPPDTDLDELPRTDRSPTALTRHLQAAPAQAAVPAEGPPAAGQDRVIRDAEAPRDPRSPRVVLGRGGPYRGWILLLIFLLVACAVGYLGWLLGLQLIGSGYGTGAAAALLGGRAGPPAG